MKRHYNLLHQGKYGETVRKLREDLVKKLRNSLCVGKNIFKKPIKENESALIASCKVAEKSYLLFQAIHKSMNLKESAC